jgi:hypothetical protein
MPRLVEAIISDRSAPQKHVWRAAIILATAEGCGTAEIMRRSGKSKPVVWRWQARREGPVGYCSPSIDLAWRQCWISHSAEKAILQVGRLLPLDIERSYARQGRRAHVVGTLQDTTWEPFGAPFRRRRRSRLRRGDCCAPLPDVTDLQSRHKRV